MLDFRGTLLLRHGPHDITERYPIEGTCKSIDKRKPSSFEELLDRVDKYTALEDSITVQGFNSI